jgi:hypothetical protein
MVGTAIDGSEVSTENRGRKRERNLNSLREGNSTGSTARNEEIR